MLSDDKFAVRRVHWAACAGMAASLLIVACGDDTKDEPTKDKEDAGEKQEKDASTAKPAAHGCGEASPGDESRSQNWSSYGHDLTAARAALGETKISVDNVATLVEKWRYDYAGITSTPAVVDGKVYFGDFDGTINSYDAKTGSKVWSTKLTSLVTASPAVTDTLVLTGGEGGKLYAVDRATGAKQWDHLIDGAQYLRLWGSPAVSGNTVVNGVASYQVFVPGSPPFRGHIAALDLANKGAELWKTFVTEGDGTGISVWSSPAIDEKRKLVFIGTGQQYSGSSKYSDSLVAMDLETGEIKWNYQFTPNDTYTSSVSGPDFDVGSTPNLMLVDGKALVGVGDKGGSYAVFERETGKLLWRKQLLRGSPNGGVTASSATSDGVVYIVCNDGASGGVAGSGANGPTRAKLYALDALTGDECWSKPTSKASFSAVTYANGVVYHTTIDGKLHAHNAKTGDEIWTQDLGRTSASGVSVSDGMLYVGTGWDWRRSGAGQVPGSLIAYGLP